MSPIIHKKREKLRLPSKYLMIILSSFCVVSIVLSFFLDIPVGPVHGFVSRTIIPFQQGVSAVSQFAVDKVEAYGNMQELLEENKTLREQVTLLTNENILLQQDMFELNNLRQLYKLDTAYTEYKKVGARIISKDMGNWFDSFIIDKGVEDGLSINMNVMAGSGLVGYISEVGPNWARVVSIIDDTSNTSGKVLSTGDNIIVSGDLKEMVSGNILYKQLIDSNNAVSVGDKIVTSSISDKYLPGILIGYITSISVDSNNLTKSGLLTPAVDFEHLEEVLVVLQLKQTVSY